MKTQEEIYIHYLESIQKLNNSWNILREIKRKRIKGYILTAAFQFALIEYSKPFLRSEGNCTKEGNRREQYCIDFPKTLIEYSKLHSEIILNRNKIFAHDDLTVKEAKVSIGVINGKKDIGYISNYIHGLELFPRIDEIIKLIEKVLDNMYKYQRELEEQVIEELT